MELQDFIVKGLSYTIRSAVEEDAKKLSEVRLKPDGETENFDREKGEGFIDESGFRKIINEDAESSHNLFLVAEVHGKIAGFIRAAGNELKRTSHRVEFGIGVLREYWGHAIGKNLLKKLIHWADCNGIRKITLHVLETNTINLADGNYYNTIVMGRINEKN